MILVAGSLRAAIHFGACCLMKQRGKGTHPACCWARGIAILYAGVWGEDRSFPQAHLLRGEETGRLQQERCCAFPAFLVCLEEGKREEDGALSDPACAIGK